MSDEVSPTALKRFYKMIQKLIDELKTLRSKIDDFIKLKSTTIKGELDIAKYFRIKAEFAKLPDNSLEVLESAEHIKYKMEISSLECILTQIQKDYDQQRVELRNMSKKYHDLVITISKTDCEKADLQIIRTQFDLEIAVLKEQNAVLKQKCAQKEAEKKEINISFRRLEAEKAALIIEIEELKRQQKMRELSLE